jgi:hypothetical protein
MGRVVVWGSGNTRGADVVGGEMRGDSRVPKAFLWKGVLILDSSLGLG